MTKLNNAKKVNSKVEDIFSLVEFIDSHRLKTFKLLIQAYSEKPEDEKVRDKIESEYNYLVELAE